MKKTVNRSLFFAAFIGLMLFQFTSAQAQSAGAPASNTTSVTTTKETGIVFPDVDGWEKSEIRTYPTAELGYSLAYQSREGGTVSVYVYNAGLKSIGNGVTDNAVKEEIEHAKDDIRTIAKMGVYQDVKEIKDETITLGGTAGKVKSLYSLFNFKLKGDVMTSEIYLFGYNNNFIKIRATRPKAAEGTTNAALVKLLATLDTMFSK
jgi:hypothetical protein